MSHSSAARHTSPSPCMACGSPHENSAPSSQTGSHSVLPAVRCRVSMLPPPLWGGNDGSGPSPSGWLPIVPRKGENGTRMPGATSADLPSRRSKVFTNGSGKSSGSSPRSGSMPHHPHSPGVISRMSMRSVSPGWAPST